MFNLRSLKEKNQVNYVIYCCNTAETDQVRFEKSTIIESFDPHKLSKTTLKIIKAETFKIKTLMKISSTITLLVYQRFF